MHSAILGIAVAVLTSGCALRSTGAYVSDGGVNRTSYVESVTVVQKPDGDCEVLIRTKSGEPGRQLYRRTLERAFCEDAAVFQFIAAKMDADATAAAAARRPTPAAPKPETAKPPKPDGQEKR